MDRRTGLRCLLGFAAAATAVATAPESASADWVRVRPKVRRWISRHRRYLHHHLPRRRRR
jgi:hypothetical protein